MILGYSNEEILGLWVCLLLSPFIQRRVSSLISAANRSNEQVTSSLSITVLILLLFATFISNHTVIIESIVSSWYSFSIWYNACLRESPILTKCFTSSIFTFAGDSLAQFFETHHGNDRNSKAAKSRHFIASYDRRRGFAFALDGILLSGPLLHFAYNLMEDYFPTTDGESYLSSFIHIAINDYCIDTVYIALSFVFVGIVEGLGVDGILSIFKKDYVGTVKASWCTSFVLIPVEFICFRFFPLGYRVLAMNCIDVFWQAIVSFFAHKSRRESKTKKLTQRGRILQ